MVLAPYVSETAARLMAAHARLSVRTQRPVYHFVIAFDPGDPGDRESMRRVADAVLRKLAQLRRLMVRAPAITGAIT